jgi:hypothetical protein
MSNNTRYRLQLQHMAHERNRHERRRQDAMTDLNVDGGDGERGDDENNNSNGHGLGVKVHQISNHDEGVLYTQMITVSFPPEPGVVDVLSLESARSCLWEIGPRVKCPVDL